MILRHNCRPTRTHSYRLILEPLEPRWLLSASQVAELAAPLTLSPGDANGDTFFERDDVIQVLHAGKYLTGESATWSEGDWNGDGVFDQFDIMAAFRTASYESYPSPSHIGNEDTLGQGIQRTMRLLATSTAESPNTVRILFYGQSITAQDWWQSVVADLRDRFPHANLIVENRAIGGFTSNLLVKTAETDLYSFYPDLLIFHVYGWHTYYEDIIRRVRQRTTAEILIQTDHVTSDEQLSEETDNERLTTDDMEAWRNYLFLPSIARRYETGLVDVRTLWKQYLVDNNLTASDLLRDVIHLNRHGNYLMAELVKAHLRYDTNLAAPADQWVTTVQVGADVERNTAPLPVVFSGNRIDVIVDAETSFQADFLIDGKSPSEFPSVYGVTRTSDYPGTNWPSLLKVGGVQPLVLEDWRLILREVSPDLTQFRFEVFGSVTGYDGEGQSDRRFESDSSRVIIDPKDWNLRYAFWASNQVVDEGFPITWQVVPDFVNQVSLGPEELGKTRTITVAQALPTGVHRLEILGPSTDSITAVRVYSPPWG